jgi:competence protein ComGC
LWYFQLCFTIDICFTTLGELEMKKMQINTAKQRLKKMGQAGFTMVELALVIITIAVLAGLYLAVADTSGTKGLAAFVKAKQVADALRKQKVDTGSYPLHVATLTSPTFFPAANWVNNRAMTAATWKGPYLRDVQVVTGAFTVQNGFTVAPPNANAIDLSVDVSQGAAIQIGTQTIPAAPANGGVPWRRYMVQVGPFDSEVALAVWAKCNKTSLAAPTAATGRAYPATVVSNLTCAVDNTNATASYAAFEVDVVRN